MKNKTIPLFKVFMSQKAPSMVSEVLQGGFIGEGPQVKELEKELLTFFGSYNDESKIVLVNSATSAEHLVYHMLKSDRAAYSKDQSRGEDIFWPKLDPEDEVLTTPLTSQATNWPILLNSLNLKWVDINPANLNISLSDLENKINQKTRIISVVHFGGNPIDMVALENITKKAEQTYGRPIAILEDCAHSFGSIYSDGINVGFRGNLSTFSLQAIKHITSGDGGFIVTPSNIFEAQAKNLRWYGIDRDEGGQKKDFRFQEDIEEVGFKFHMNDISAVIARANLSEATRIISANKDNGNFYNNCLKDISGITLMQEVGESAYWLYSIHVEKRDDFMRVMAERGITCSRVHQRNDKYSCMKDYVSTLPGLDKAEKTRICIPVGYWVNTEDREYIVDAIKKGW